MIRRIYSIFQNLESLPSPVFHYFCSALPIFSEGSPGCNPPDLRVTKPRRHSQTTTSSPILTFETTQIYLPEDFTTGDLEFINHNKDAIKAAFRNSRTGELLFDDVGIHDDLSLHHVNYSPTYTWNDQKKNFEHSKDPNQRTRRAAVEIPSSSMLKLRQDAGVLTISEAPAVDNKRNNGHISKRRRRSGHSSSTVAKRSLVRNDYEVERIYIQSTDLVSSLQQSPAARGDLQDNQIRATNRTNDDNDGNGAAEVGPASELNLLQNASGVVLVPREHPEALMPNTTGGEDINPSAGESNKELLRRVKRKSGKTTGALSRPKGDSSSSSSKSTSRKTQCKYIL